MARKRAEGDGPNATPAPASPAATMTKTDAVKAALAEGIESPEEGVAFIKSKFGLDITKPQFSTYKSLSKKKNGAGMRSKAPAKTVTSASAPSRAATGDVAFGVETIKGLVDKMGVDQVVRIAQLFGK